MLKPYSLNRRRIQLHDDVVARDFAAFDFLDPIAPDDYRSLNHCPVRYSHSVGNHRLSNSRASLDGNVIPEYGFIDAGAVINRAPFTNDVREASLAHEAQIRLEVTFERSHLVPFTIGDVTYHCLARGYGLRENVHRRMREFAARNVLKDSRGHHLDSCKHERGTIGGCNDCCTF